MWILWAILASLTAATVMILTKVGLKNVDSSLAFAIQSVLILAITWTVVITQGNSGNVKNIDQKTWIILILAGVATSLSTLFSYKALSMGPSSMVVTIERTSLVFTLILSVVFLKEKLTWQLIAGAVLILSGAILIALSAENE
ncbi:EamA family transporter [Pedobacter sp. MC2016-14]|uniref:EamA family transporter n=1 Tax=Pedobacter sp. MC2016-14 TaxID=2897327 RepID=UPI00210205B6|nr:EamA family transporter [Pedobacter sp. MC2016-14]